MQYVLLENENTFFVSLLYLSFIKSTNVSDHFAWPCILEQQNNKQKLLILEALHIRMYQPKRNRINFESVLIYLNVFSYYRYL